MSQITDRVREVIAPIATEMNFEVVDVEFQKSMGGARPALTVFVYTESGVDLDLLERVHKRVDAALDDVDITNGATYDLNVSSPGLDRPLKNERDFERNLGNLLEIKLFKPEDGKKLFVGTLKSFDKDSVTVVLDDESEKTFQIKQTAKISQAIIFD